MFEQTFEVGEVLEEFEYKFAGLEFGLELVLVERADVVVEFVYVGLLSGHFRNLNPVIISPKSSTQPTQQCRNNIIEIIKAAGPTDSRAQPTTTALP